MTSEIGLPVSQLIALAPQQVADQQLAILFTDVGEFDPDQLLEALASSPSACRGFSRSPCRRSSGR
jgi:hypothetical protein